MGGGESPRGAGRGFRGVGGRIEGGIGGLRGFKDPDLGGSEDFRGGCSPTWGAVRVWGGQVCDLGGQKGFGTSIWGGL